MFKKILALILCALMLMTAAMAEEFTAPAPGDPLSLEADIGLYLDGIFYPILNDFATLEAILGEADEVNSAPSCAFKGDDKEFVYDGMSIFTNPLGELDVWMEAYITGGDYVTTRGIGIGSSEADVLAAYGDGFYVEGENMMTYSLSGDPEAIDSPCIIFTLEDGAVVCMDIYFPTNTI